MLSSCDLFMSTPNVIDFVRMACTIEPPPEVLCGHPSCEIILDTITLNILLKSLNSTNGVDITGKLSRKKCSRAGHKYMWDNREVLWILFNFLTVQYLVLFNS